VSHVTTNQPDGTPTWIDLGVPDLERAKEFYRALFGWDYEDGWTGAGQYTLCLLNGRRVAGLAPNPDPAATDFWWNMYFAAADCDGTAKRITDAGGTLVVDPADVGEQGRLAIAKDTVGAQFGLWQGRAFVGCETVNEPGSLVRNDLITPTPDPARAFYPAVFDFTLKRNPDMPELDFTFLHRPDGGEIGGIVGQPAATSSAWATIFEVDDTDAAVARATAAGATCGPISDNPYVRIASVTDPFGAEFQVGARPS
jgi:predicted enzyme related to lactoylglutathione lyase